MAALAGTPVFSRQKEQADAARVDPVIENARRAAAAFTVSLPKYLVKRTTTRYESVRPTCPALARISDPDECGIQAIESWRQVDVITADVVTDKGREVDLNIGVNGSPATKKDLDASGSWSEGDFAGTLQAILSPASAAEFTRKHAGIIVNRPAFRYDYAIAQSHSSWHLYAGDSSYSPGYSGQIWFDRDTSRVLHVDMAAQKLPDSFPMNKIEWSVDYDFVRIFSQTHLLPRRSETKNCDRSSSICSRNTTDFQGYKEYSADSNITFDSAPK
jgi:hypothetical protein